RPAAPARRGGKGGEGIHRHGSRSGLERSLPRRPGGVGEGPRGPEAEARGRELRGREEVSRGRKGNDERPAAQLVWGPAPLGGRGPDLNDRGIPGPARVSGERHGKSGDVLARSGPDRAVGAAPAALVLHPVRAAARHAAQRRPYLAFGNLRYRLLVLAADG